MQASIRNRNRFLGRGPLAVAVAAAMSAGATMPAAAQQAGAAPALEEVVVTGSRIARRDLAAASPIVTVEDQAFEESSTLAVESVLNQLPQFVPSTTQFTTSDTFPSATSTPGATTVNMRGLGSNRTLVLIDGRRGQPINSTLVIDTNSIPSSALQSVEIISGGASAVYGADALGGVTNFILRSDFEGIDLQFRTGITERGDGEEHRVSMLLGSSLGDGRGNAMLGLEWTERGEVMAIDRPFFRRGLDDPLTNSTSAARLNRFQYQPGGGNAPSQDVANALFPQRPDGRNVPTNSVFLFNHDGTLFKEEMGGLGFEEDIEGNPLYKVRPTGTLAQNNFDFRYSSPLERYSLFGKAYYGMTDWLEAYSQVSFVSTTNRQVLQPTGAVGGFGASIPHGNGVYAPSVDADGNTLPEYLAGGAYGLDCPATGGCTNSQAFPVPEQLATLLASRGDDVFSTTQFNPNTGQPVVTSGANSNWGLGVTMDFLPARTIENNSNVYQLIGGFRGATGLGDWTYDAYVSHGATRVDLDYIGFVSLNRWQEVVQSPNYGQGAEISGAGSTQVSCTSGIPVFGAPSISDDCVNSITANYTDRTRLTQEVFEATAQGGLFELPAGEMRGAVGATYRRNDFRYNPDASRARNSFMDIPVGTFGQADVEGRVSVSEVYGELLVPVVGGLPFVQNLELELGYRYSDYNTSGGVPTWKALFSWQTNDYVRFRGGYQLANRAPNINELFLDASSQATTMRTADYCRADTNELSGNNPANPNRAQAQALCQALIGNTTSEFSADPDNYFGGRSDGVILQINSGNIDLESEEGETWTFGVVLDSPFQSPALSGATLSLDWYRAKITQAIATVGAQTSYDLCFNRDGQSNPNYDFNDPNGVCQNIVRDEVTGAALVVNAQFQNLGIIDTSGIDASFNWRASMADLGMQNMPGGLGLNVSFSKLFDFKAQDFPTQIPLEYGGTLSRGGLFDWRAVTTLRYFHENWSAALNWRHLPSVRHFSYPTNPETTVQGASSYSVFGLTGNWNINEWLGISGGIDNLLDTQPRRIGAGQVQNIAPVNGGGQVVLNGAASTSAGFYDVLGRRYFVNLKMRF